MKKYDVVEILEHCAKGDCENCPVADDNGACDNVTLRALEIIKEQKAMLEQPTAMPNYEAMYYDLQREKTRLMTENAVMGEELAFLRAVKATAEAFLGREIK